jgi:hypothetical protein
MTWELRIEGKADLAVPEGLHDDSRVHALHQQQGRAGVSKVVKPNRRKLRPS